MVVARTKRVWGFSPWLTMLLGVALFAVGVINLNYEDVKSAPLVWLLATCLLIFILFVLPMRNIGTYEEIIINKLSLKLRKQPANKEIKYNLLELSQWQLLPSAGRYDYGRNLHLIFADGSKVHISEMAYDNFEAIIEYLESGFLIRKSD